MPLKKCTIWSYTLLVICQQIEWISDSTNRQNIFGVFRNVEHNFQEMRDFGNFMVFQFTCHYFQNPILHHLSRTWNQRIDFQEMMELWKRTSSEEEPGIEGSIFPKSREKKSELYTHKEIKSDCWSFVFTELVERELASEREGLFIQRIKIKKWLLFIFLGRYIYQNI